MKILVIDDNTSITKALDKYLKLKGNDVKICNEGSDGFDLIKSQKWDKVLLDLSMPEYSGFDIIENLEKEHLLKNNHIVIFSAAAIPEHLVEKLEKKDGIVTFIRKPTPLARIAEILAA